MATLVWPISVTVGRMHTTNTPDPGLTTDGQTNISQWVCEYGPGAQQDLHFSQWITSNYLSGTPTLDLAWKTDATSGTVIWNAAYRYTANNADYNSSGGTAAGTTACPGVANQIVNTQLALPTGVAADRVLLYRISHMGASDSFAGTVQLMEARITHTVDPTVNKQWVYIPANAFAIPSASGAQLLKIEDTNKGVYPYALGFRDGTVDYADYHFRVPSNYLANFKVSPIWANEAILGTVSYRLDFGTVAVGGSADPVLTAGAEGTVQWSTASDISYPALAAPVVTPAASYELMCRVNRMGTAAADLFGGTAYLIGMLCEYESFQKNPGVIFLDAPSGSQPSDAANITKVNGTNTSRWVVRYAPALVQSIDYLQRLPSTYKDSALVRARWTSNAASGTAKFELFYGSPAVGADADPALVSAGTISSPHAGSALINEFSGTVSTGMGASDLALIRVRHIGTADSFSLDIDLLTVALEANIL